MTALDQRDRRALGTFALLLALVVAVLLVGSAAAGLAVRVFLLVAFGG